MRIHQACISRRRRIKSCRKATECQHRASCRHGGSCELGLVGNCTVAPLPSRSLALLLRPLLWHDPAPCFGGRVCLRLAHVTFVQPRPTAATVTSAGGVGCRRRAEHKQPERSGERVVW